jgi:hypothetical protein
MQADLMGDILLISVNLILFSVVLFYTMTGNAATPPGGYQEPDIDPGGKFDRKNEINIS